jgi:predicted CXXCH cytochrome family protein
MNKKSLFFATTLAAISVICFLNLFCNSSPEKKISSPENIYLNHHDSVKYVGIETCRSCHNDIYKTFIETGMGQSFNIASKQKTAANFSKHHVVYDKFSDMHYYPFFKNDSMYILEFRMEGKDTVHKRIERVDYIVGSGQHTNSHLMNVNGYLYQLPLTWYAQKRKWDLPPGFENGRNVRFNRVIGFECMSCHNALPVFVENSLNKFNTIPRGIDCERCHGPGEIHVKEKLAGIRVDTSTQIDYTIVNPKKLSWERQIDLCQRCHLQGNAILKNGKTFSDFKPGMRLSDFIDIYMPKYKGHDDEFIMASHAQRLQMSKCFLNKSHTKQSTLHQAPSTISLTCITCHNPHISVKVTGKQIFNNACSNCHNVKTSCKEDIKLRAQKNDNCVGCHMPKSGTIDIPHVTVTDHWIRIPAKKNEANKIKEFVGIYCINNKNSDDEIRSKAYLSYYEKFEGESRSLDSAEYYLSKNTHATDFLSTQIHYLFLKNAYNKIIELTQHINPSTVNEPWMCYRIGQTFQNLQEAALAENWYKRAVEIAPDNLDFINKLGASQIEQNKLDEGIKTMQLSLQKNPKQSIAFTNLGFAYLKQNNTQKAMDFYNQALALDPDFEQALLNKAGLYNYLGKPIEAKNMLKKILKRNPQNQQVKALLQSL